MTIIKIITSVIAITSVTVIIINIFIIIIMIYYNSSYSSAVVIVINVIIIVTFIIIIVTISITIIAIAIITSIDQKTEQKRILHFISAYSRHIVRSYDTFCLITWLKHNHHKMKPCLNPRCT